MSGSARQRLLSQRLRDQVRLRLPRALWIYQNHISPLLGADRAPSELLAWARRGATLMAQTGMYGIRFERDGIWIDDGDGCLWRYAPEVAGSTTVGAELGIQYEKNEIAALAERLPKGGLLVDVGANVGLHAVKLAKLVEGLRVLALEPVGETFALLNGNLVKNGVADRVETRQIAVAEEPGILRMTTTLALGNFVVPADQTAAAGVVESVACERLDDVVSGHERLDGLKIDVEGAELGVLRGGTSTLERHRPTVLIEIDDRWAARYGNTGRDVVELLTDTGYRYERFVDGQLLPPGRSVGQDLSEGVNFLFSPRA